MDKVNKLSKLIIAELKSNANEKVLNGARYYFVAPNIIKNIGVSLKQLDYILKGFKVDINNLTAEEVRLLCDNLVRTEIDEAIHLAFRIFKFKAKYDDKTKLFALLQSWLNENRLQNWALIDLCSLYLLTYCMEGSPKIRAALFKYTDSEIIWHRRIAIVGYVTHAKHGRYLDEFYLTAEKLINDKEDLMQKAVGWILRNAGVTDKGRLIKFLNKHGKKMGRTALRYAIEHLPEDERKLMLFSTK